MDVGSLAIDPGKQFQGRRPEPTARGRPCFFGINFIDSACAMLTRKIRKFLKNSPALLMGYNPYVDADKLRLIDRAFATVPAASSFADLGGVWKVNAAYSRYTLRKHKPERGVLVDTDFPPGLKEKLSRLDRLEIIPGDFTAESTLARIGKVDIAYFFDVLLHQANPSWDEVLRRYASRCSCFVVFNQQYVGGKETLRLTDLPLEEYKRLAPQRT